MMLLDMCMDVLLQDEINIIKLLYMHIEKTCCGIVSKLC